MSRNEITLQEMFSLVIGELPEGSPRALTFSHLLFAIMEEFSPMVKALHKTQLLLVTPSSQSRAGPARPNIASVSKQEVEREY